MPHYDMKATRWVAAACCVALVTACNSGSLGNAPAVRATSSSGEAEPAPTPFPVTDDAEDLILSWFDAEGLHTAHRRSDVPEHRRAHVRVDSLSIAPEQRLDASLVYVADLRAAQPNGQYPVRTMPRSEFDALVDKEAGVSINVAAPTPADDEPTGDPPRPNNAGAGNTDSERPVIIYMASWCGACRAAAAHLRQRGVPFEERDVERDKGAGTEMRRKAQAAGVQPRGVPVIDFRGTLVLGFDKQRLDQLIDRRVL